VTGKKAADRDNAAQVDAAGKTDAVVEADKGGIDLNPAGLNMSIKGDGSAPVNALDPAMFEELQGAPGFVPVILGITPVGDLPVFLGVSRN
jgi:hypothetical protein